MYLTPRLRETPDFEATVWRIAVYATEIVFLVGGLCLSALCSFHWKPRHPLCWICGVWQLLHRHGRRGSGQTAALQAQCKVLHALAKSPAPILQSKSYALSRCETWGWGSDCTDLSELAGRTAQVSVRVWLRTTASAEFARRMDAPWFMTPVACSQSFIFFRSCRPFACVSSVWDGNKMGSGQRTKCDGLKWKTIFINLHFQGPC